MDIMLDWPVLTEPEYNARVRHDITFCEAYDDYAHYLRVQDALRNK